jgi:hypothetical protein
MVDWKWYETVGGWSKLHKEEFHNFYSSPSIIRVIKLSRLRPAVHVAHNGGGRILCKNKKEINHYGDLDVGTRIIIIMAVEKQNVVILTGSIWVSVGLL